MLNYLKKTEGDQINALPADWGFNLRKLLRAFFLFLFEERDRGLFCSLKKHLENSPKSLPPSKTEFFRDD